MATSIRLKLRKSICPHKERNLYFQLIYKRQIKQLCTSFKLYPWEWDEKMMIVKNRVEDAKRSIYLLEIQQKINQETEMLHALVCLFEEQGEYSLTELSLAYTNHSLNGFLFPFMEELIHKLTTAGHTKTASSYLCALRSFKTFRKGKDIGFKQLNRTMLKDYECFLKNKGVTLNTISFYMRILRAVYNRAIYKGLPGQNHLFRGIYTGVEKTVKRAVNGDIIKRLKALDLSCAPKLALARDLFLFSFYTRGMSFVDMAYLKKENINDDLLSYRRRKTGQQLHIKTEPCILEIIERYADKTADVPYLLPIFIKENPRLVDIQYRNAIYNQNARLKKLSQLLHLKIPLTSYVARHTWATIAKQNNIPLAIISEGMGHDSERTTRIYLASLDQSIVDNANNLILAQF